MKIKKAVLTFLSCCIPQSELNLKTQSKFQSMDGWMGQPYLFAVDFNVSYIILKNL